MRPRRNKINSASASKLFNMAAMSGRSRVVGSTIRNLSHIVAEAMQEMHGGSWRAVIDNDDLFIVIRPQSGSIDGAIARPKRGAVT